MLHDSTGEEAETKKLIKKILYSPKQNDNEACYQLFNILSGIVHNSVAFTYVSFITADAKFVVEGNRSTKSYYTYMCDLYRPVRKNGLVVKESLPNREIFKLSRYIESEVILPERRMTDGNETESYGLEVSYCYSETRKTSRLIITIQRQQF